MKKRIKVKRVYDNAADDDGARILVDRIWPRGIRKEALKIDSWFKDIAPSNELRKWFAHEPKKWEVFKRKYFLELKKKKSLCNELLIWKKNNLTLLYSAKDEKYNQAVALKEFLQKEIM